MNCTLRLDTLRSLSDRFSRSRLFLSSGQLRRGAWAFVGVFVFAMAFPVDAAEKEKSKPVMENKGGEKGAATAADSAPLPVSAAKGKDGKDAGQDKDTLVLFDGTSLADWETVDIGGSGEVALEDGEMVIAQGDSVSGAVYKKPQDLPLQTYEITLEAMRLEGVDFFCGLTFPVNSLNTCLTLVLGGWGGSVTGLSSIDGLDAAENNTSSYQRYEDNKWYQVRLQVRPKEIKVWINDKEVVNTDIEDKKLGVRPGPIESYQPLSLTTYQTLAAIRKVRVRRL